MIKDSDTIELTSIPDNTPELKEVADNLARNVMLTKATNNDLQKLNTAFFTDEDGAHIKNNEGYQTDLVGDSMIIKDQAGNQVSRFGGEVVLGDETKSGNPWVLLDNESLGLWDGVARVNATPYFIASKSFDGTATPYYLLGGWPNWPDRVGYYSLNAGYDCIGDGDYTATFGYHNRNSQDGALVIGKYNNDDGSLFAIGNGNAEYDRHNCFTVNNDGNVTCNYINDWDITNLGDGETIGNNGANHLEALGKEVTVTSVNTITLMMKRQMAYKIAKDVYFVKFDLYLNSAATIPANTETQVLASITVDGKTPTQYTPLAGINGLISGNIGALLYPASSTNCHMYVNSPQQIRGADSGYLIVQGLMHV